MSGAFGASLGAVIVVVAVAIMGCSGPPYAEREAGFDLDQFGGQVDGQLSADQQLRQAVVRRWLLGLVDGLDPADSKAWLSGTTIAEASADFYSGAVNLRRWGFDGSPSADGEVPVWLEFIVDDASGEVRTERRTYRVTGQPGAWIVRRSRSPQDSP